MNSPKRIFVTKLAGMGGNAGDRIRGLDFSVLPIGLGVASGPNMEGRKSELDAIPLMVAWPLPMCRGKCCHGGNTAWRREGAQRSAVTNWV